MFFGDIVYVFLVVLPVLGPSLNYKLVDVALRQLVEGMKEWKVADNGRYSHVEGKDANASNTCSSSS